LEPLIVTSFTGVNCLGAGVDAWWDALSKRRSGLRRCAFEDVALDTFIGEVEGLERIALRDDLAEFDCRNDRPAALGLEQDGFSAAVCAARERYGAKRMAVVLDVQIRDTNPETALDDPALESLRLRNAAARSLPLLRALALDEKSRVTLAYVSDRSLAIEAKPCQ
jgi:hypothetical protein